MIHYLKAIYEIYRNYLGILMGSSLTIYYCNINNKKLNECYECIIFPAAGSPTTTLLRLHHSY